LANETVLRELQARDITVEDYETLLQLDGPALAPLHRLVVDALEDVVYAVLPAVGAIC
jgi:hypothetical protein